jgi:putative methyltransferase (TIGR04325 family)
LKRQQARTESKATGYAGRFDNWLQAKGTMSGYQDPKIAATVAAAAQKVLSGSAVYERDSVTFNQREFSFPLATALLWIASQTPGRLRVLDFGGGLGTSYFQNLPFLNRVPDLEWYIVEQPSFVEQARVGFEGQRLKFFSNLNACLQASKPQFALLSSSLQYVEKPYEVLREIVEANIEVVMVDRTLFSSEASDYATLQHVSENIFPAVIPTWVFSQQRFVEYMQKSYHLVAEFPAFKSTTSLDQDRRNLQELGYLFVLKGSVFDLALYENQRG